MSKVYNFAAGPSTLPLEVLKTAQEQMLNYKGSGMSVMEMSHRSSAYQEIFDETKATLKRLLKIPDNYKILLLHGGATQQFSALALNLMQTGKADYIVTGSFSGKAAKEAAKFGDVHIAYDGKENNYTHIPTQDELDIREGVDYVHLCENNTIYGTEWNYVPDTKGAPLVADMSSDILSRPVDVSKYGVIYAGAQKNMGIAGLGVVIIREDLIKPHKENIPLYHQIPCDKPIVILQIADLDFYLIFRVLDGVVYQIVYHIGDMELVGIDGRRLRLQVALQ